MHLILESAIQRDRQRPAPTHAFDLPGKKAMPQKIKKHAMHNNDGSHLLTPSGHKLKFKI